MSKESTAAALVAEAESALRAADDIGLLVMVKQASAEYDEGDWSQLADLPDLSTGEIDPEEVYRYLVHMVGEERAQQILVDASADAIEAGIDEQEGRAPSRQDLADIFQRISMQGGDEGEGWDAGEWGGQ